MSQPVQPGHASGRVGVGPNGLGDWSFNGQWPFRPHYFTHSDGRLAFVDEGRPSHPAVVLMHGNPTWGFLYRRFIGPLVAAGRRVIVPDLLGFGRSDKPPNPALYTVDAHVARLTAVLGSLGLQDTSLVVHDWGGPIGLAWAKQRPGAIARLLLLNTFAPVLPGPMGGGRRNRFLRAPVLGEFFFKGANVMTKRFLFSEGVARPEHLTEETKRAYLAPHPTRGSRTGILAFPRQIPRRSNARVANLSRETARWAARELANSPVRLVWGIQDPLFGHGVIDEWLQLLPHAAVRRLAEASHYIQEDRPGELLDELLAFVADDAERGRSR